MECSEHSGLEGTGFALQYQQGGILEKADFFVFSFILEDLGFSGGSVKSPPGMQETWVQFLGREEPLGKGMATHSSSLAWRIPWTEEPGELQSTGSQRARHD